MAEKVAFQPAQPEAAVLELTASEEVACTIVPLTKGGRVAKTVRDEVE